MQTISISAQRGARHWHDIVFARRTRRCVTSMAGQSPTNRDSSRKKEHTMTSLTKTLTAIALAALTGTVPANADEETVTMLLNQPLAGMDGKEVTVLQIDVPGGFETPRHLHPGHMFMYVLEGAVELDVEGQPPAQLAPGQVAYELPNLPMIGRNMSASDPARLLIFAVSDAGAPIEIPAPE